MESQAVACFDADGAAAFATACHLAAGDPRFTVDLLIAAVQRAAAGADEPTAVDDVRRLPLLVHRVALEPAFAGGPRQPVGVLASLSMRDRVALSLDAIEHRSLGVIAELLQCSAAIAEVTLASARASLEQQAPGEVPADVFLATETWLDDATRDRIRTALQQPPAGRETSVTAQGERDTSWPKLARSWRRPGSRATTIGVAVAVVAFVVVGAVWISPSHHDASSALARTIASLPPVPDAVSVPPPTSAEATSRVHGPPGYVIQRPPLGLAVVGAYDAAIPDDRSWPAWVELWATPGATRTSGRWLAVATAEALTATDFDIGTTIRHVQINGRDAAFRAHADGIQEIAATTDAGGGAFSVTGYGMSPAGFSSIAGSISVVDGEPVFGPAAAQFLAGTSQLVNRGTLSLDLTEQTDYSGSATSYGTGADSPYVQISTVAQTANDTLLDQFLLDPVSDPSLTIAADHTLSIPTDITDSLRPSSRLVSVGQDSHGQLVVQWHDATDTVTMYGDLDPATMMFAAESAHKATATEWSALARQVDETTTHQPSPGALTSNPGLAPIGSAGTTSGGAWNVQMSADHSSLYVGFADFGQPNDGFLETTPFAFDPDHPLVEYGSLGATLVVVVVLDPGTATGLRVAVRGTDAVTLSLTPLNSAQGPTVATAYAFSEFSPFTAQLVDAAGTVVRDLTPTQS
ncbi:MAG TPA: hypothetical protein VGM78_06305 [Ilumatobacteraceae bacterium]